MIPSDQCCIAQDSRLAATPRGVAILSLETSEAGLGTGCRRAPLVVVADAQGGGEGAAGELPDGLGVPRRWSRGS